MQRPASTRWSKTESCFGICSECLQQQRRVRIDAPSNVEVVVTDDPNARKLRIHLLAYNSTPRTTPQKNRPFVLPGMIEDKPIFRVTVSINEQIKKATSLTASTDLETNGQQIKATIEDIHELLIVDY